MEQKQVDMQTWAHRWEGNESTVKNTTGTKPLKKKKKIIAGVS